MILKEADIIVTKLRAFCKTIFIAISVKNFPTILLRGNKNSSLSLSHLLKPCYHDHKLNGFFMA